MCLRLPPLSCQGDQADAVGQVQRGGERKPPGPDSTRPTFVLQSALHHPDSEHDKSEARGDLRVRGHIIIVVRFNINIQISIGVNLDNQKLLNPPRLPFLC